jgi:hypothetical protein
MNLYDASNPDASKVRCAVCDNEIRGGHWFARIRHEELVVALCCPLCTETFEGNPHAYTRRIKTIAGNT